MKIRIEIDIDKLEGSKATVDKVGDKIKWMDYEFKLLMSGLVKNITIREEDQGIGVIERLPDDYEIF